MTDPSDQPSARQHYWDAARGGLMLLGIPYHAALAYRTGGWIVSARDQSPLLGPVADLIHLFRMPAFFLVAGYFAAMLLARRPPGEWLRGRLQRLGIPLVTALVLIVPPMNIAGELVGQPWPLAEAAWRRSTSSSGGYWVRHLWFLIVLIYYSLGAAGLARWRPAMARWTLPERVDSGVARALPLVLLAAGVAVGLYLWGVPLLFARAGLATNLGQEVLRADEALSYLPFFLIGWLLERAPATLARFTRIARGTTLLALAATTAALVATTRIPALAPFVGGLAAVLDAQLAIALARTLADRPSLLVDRLVDAAFVIYLVHLPLVILLVGLFRHVGGPPLAQFAGVCLLTLALSYAAARIVARVALLDLLFNGRTRR